MDGWSIFRFGIIPILTVTIIFIVRRKLLWIAPWISTALVFITYMISLGLITDLSKMVSFFSSYEHRWYLFMAMLLHLAIVLILMLVAYLVAYVRKRKKK